MTNQKKVLCKCGNPKDERSKVCNECRKRRTKIKTPKVKCSICQKLIKGKVAYKDTKEICNYCAQVYKKADMNNLKKCAMCSRLIPNGFEASKYCSESCRNYAKYLKKNRKI
ncbi:MAG: hypothetical protein ACTSQ4_02220 [Candidatus Heimdallarchaeaceae archaeon]